MPDIFKTVKLGRKPIEVRTGHGNVTIRTLDDGSIEVELAAYDPETGSATDNIAEVTGPRLLRAVNPLSRAWVMGGAR